MRKKYNKPTISVEKMNLTLLVETSEVQVGGTGTPDAKGFSSVFFEDEEYDDE